MSPPVAQPVTRAPHAVPLLHKWLHVHLIPSPCCTNGYMCTSCCPQLHNQLLVHLIPPSSCTTSYWCTSSRPPVAQLVTGAPYAASSFTTSYKCTSCCTTDISQMIACKAKKFFGTIYVNVPPILIMELSLWSVILNRQNL